MIRIDQKIYDSDTILKELKLERYRKHWIEVVIDTIHIADEEHSRIAESVEHALQVGQGTMVVIDKEVDAHKRREVERFTSETMYTTFGACPNHPEIVFERLEPRMFSFNSPYGACPQCHGLGYTTIMSENLVIPDKNKSIMDGAIAVYGNMDLSWRIQQLAAVGKKSGFDVFTPIKEFSTKQLDVLLYGTSEPITGSWSNGANMGMRNGWEGIIPQSMRLYRQTASEGRKEAIMKFMKSSMCTACKGKRLRPVVLAVKILNKSITDITRFSIEEAADFFAKLPARLRGTEVLIAKQILKEINERLGFLNNVGLGYLTLSRATRSLSGGEAQRIRLATQIGSNLMGVLYILDEPSVGLHHRDNMKLITTLHKLRDIGNTLIVVEHDENTILNADYVVDMGPGAGANGGHIVCQGINSEIMNCNQSLTGKYLSGKLTIAVPQERRTPVGFINIHGANENNLKSLSVAFPLGVLCGITGVSGSGKSTLMNLTLMPALRKECNERVDKIGKYDTITVPSFVDNVIVINQEPIGRTPRSNPATYTKLFDDIRKLFANTKEAKVRGYKPGRFSFNVKGGRCETCRGYGNIRIEMNFLPDVYIKCNDCNGKRYNTETLNIRYKGKNIAEILNMEVVEASDFFENIPTISRKLQTLIDVGLGYVKLGQSSTTLSGGESQRLKITRELSKKKLGHVVYLLDEPTTGLHFDDIKRLIQVLNSLVEKGNTVFIIEHNLDVAKSCDYLIDLGPEGGDAGGEVICKGTPEEIAQDYRSYTGKYLRQKLRIGS
ncbi:MAG: excinuclease ABC subunit UvrA [Candidatus Bathyarchaeota archaeon]|nr:MAG: excinuclease ABC subunit UvrA [Candidatus Bathyarchaeota archaeon]